MTVLISPFQVKWFFFLIFSSCVITVARTSQTMLSKNGENRHPCLAPYPKGNTISFCPLSMMLTVGFSYMAFIMLRYDPSIPTLLRVFIISRYWILLYAFSASIGMIM